VTVYRLGDDIAFPDPREADPDGLIAVGGDLRPERLLAAYACGRFEVRFDSDFRGVMERCAGVSRRHERGTWISDGMIEAYTALHERGFGHSAETWCDGELVGGIYGLALGRAFFGESMFHVRRDASKVALVVLTRRLAEWDFALLDCQVYSTHVARFGAKPWPRERYLAELARALRAPTRRGAWPSPALPRGRPAAAAGPAAAAPSRRA